MKFRVFALALLVLPLATHGLFEEFGDVQCSAVWTNPPFEVCATYSYATPSLGMMTEDDMFLSLEDYFDWYTIVTGLKKGNEVFDLSDDDKAKALSSGIDVTVQRDQQDSCNVTIDVKGLSSVCSSCSYCGDNKYTADCTYVANGRKVICESIGRNGVVYPLKASALPVDPKATPVPVKPPTKAPLAAPTQKISLPAACSGWTRPPLQVATYTRSFRATVVRKVKSAVSSYVVNVGRSILGCEIKANDRVLVTLKSAQAVSLTTGTSYLFVGGERMFQPLALDETAMLGNRTKVKLVARLGTGIRSFEWQCVHPTDTTTLRNTKKVCP
jgi:hypothetical protein